MTVEEFKNKYHVHFPDTCLKCKWYDGPNFQHDMCKHPEGFENGLDFHLVHPHSVCDLFESASWTVFKPREVEEDE